MTAARHQTASNSPALLVGLTSTLVGIGLARFAYTSLVPAVVEAHWFTTSAAVYLGAANLLGYFIGAVTAHTASERFGARATLGLSFALVTLSFIGCMHAAPFAWFFVWRLLSGLAGAWLMVIGPATALAATAPERRPIVGTLMFMGIGLGALLSAVVVPGLLQAGLWLTWLALGVLTLIAGVVGDIALYRLPRPSAGHSAVDPSAPGVGPALWPAVVLVIGAYACEGIGFVPHTMFWVDYLAREVGVGMAAANGQWALFGLGALLGPVATRWVVPRAGWHISLTLAFALKCVAVGLPFVAIGLWTRSLSSIAVGALIPGIVALTSGRLAEMVGPAEHKRLWGVATAAFALAQAVAGYGLSALYMAVGQYRVTFGIGAAVLGLGVVMAWFGHPRYFARRRGLKNAARDA
ncbi:YbfB/YjiJ family MFS transporter [Salinisphaera sp. T31B1]|uniref:YbfB/YjiJ family MFS transporter n=1 Tax=Salinisphaera sp. T31B1 TaxID=727963 RepID=UPI0033428056